jgi:deoxyribonucleoside regulator
MNKREMTFKSLLTEISTLYYEKGYTQLEISNRLNISRTRISHLLKQARDKGIVEIKVNHMFERNYALEERFKQRFDLKEVYLFSDFGKSPAEIKSGVGMLTASYLNQRITNRLVLGVSWGNAIKETVNALTVNQTIPIEVVQIMGAASITNPTLNAKELIRKIAKIYGGVPHYLDAPLFVKDEYIKQQLNSDPIISRVLDLALYADIILTGIGTINEVSVTSPWLGYMSQEIFRKIKSQKAVGCIGAHFFDRNGAAIDNEWNRQCIGIDLNSIRRIEEVIVTAAGVAKAEAISSAIKGGYIKVLMSDDETAGAIIDLYDKNRKL